MEGWKLLRNIAFGVSLWVSLSTSVWAIFIPSTTTPPPNPAGPTPTGEVTPPAPQPTSEGETPPPAPPPNPEGSGNPNPDDLPPPPDEPPPSQTPEPATLLTASIGLGLTGLYRWRKRRAEKA